MISLATRMNLLGTETAFAVSEDARSWADQGNEVFPFHLGDMNLPTPQNIVDAAMKAIHDGKTGYAPAAGIPELREAVAERVGADRGISFSPENVSIQPGGKPSIEKFLMALMNPGDEALYPNPGYPIYESQIQFFGGLAVPYGFIPTVKGFLIDRDRVESSLNPKTKIIVYNNGHNPLGAESDDDEMQWLAALAQKHNLWVFADEPYFHIRYSGKSKSIASLPGMQERTLIADTFSKTYAMTGWRLGAAIGPKEIITAISKLNVNQESCTCHFIQYAGIEALRGDQSGYHQIIDILRSRRDLLVDLLNDIEGVSVYKPEVTFYLFPEVTEVYQRLGYASQETFRLDALHKTGISFCSRTHFGQPLPGEDRVFVRFAFSGIDEDKIEAGLTKLKAFWMA